jgi:hypothetical protein
VSLCWAKVARNLLRYPSLILRVVSQCSGAASCAVLALLSARALRPVQAKPLLHGLRLQACSVNVEVGILIINAFGLSDCEV